MYKVFFNEKKIIIAPSGNITLNKPSHFIAKNCTSQELKNWFFSFVDSETNEVFIPHPKPKKLFKLFKSIFVVIKAAGGVVQRKNKILFITRNGIWDLPKGKIDKGETKQQAAIREVQEECGLKSLEIIKSLPTTYHIFQSTFSDTFGDWILKETFWFEMKHLGDEHGIPQKEEGITEIKWFLKKELDKVLLNTYKNLKETILLYRD